jgi:hypothetical protein
LALALLLAALVVPLLRPAPTLARGPHRACASAVAASEHGARACAQRAHSGHAQGNGRRHHAKHRSIKKKKAAQHRAGTRTPAPVPTPAVCEDGTTPTRGAEGAFSCGDGSEPACTAGAEPAPAKNGKKLVCPAATSANTEWTEATCENGGAPVHGSSGFGCEDGSQPECEDGSRPTASDDGSMLVCLSSGGGSGSAPTPAEEEESEESAGDALRGPVATAS